MKSKYEVIKSEIELNPLQLYHLGNDQPGVVVRVEEMNHVVYEKDDTNYYYYFVPIDLEEFEKTGNIKV